MPALNVRADPDTYGAGGNDFGLPLPYEKWGVMRPERRRDVRAYERYGDNTLRWVASGLSTLLALAALSFYVCVRCGRMTDWSNSG